MTDDHAITPGVLGLIAVLSIGGLLFLGYGAKIAGDVVTDTPNRAICCTTETWANAPSGYVQGNAQTQTVFCFSGQTDTGCCYQQVSSVSNYPIRILGIRAGPCELGAPEQAYPIWIP